MVEDFIKKDSKTNFNRSAVAYHANARVQKEVANRLIASLKPWKEILPPGPIIELGCGTGFVSRELQKLFPERELLFTDIAPNMVEQCQVNLDQASNSSFEILDAEDVAVSKPVYAMTLSSFVAQWLWDPAYTLGQWFEATLPGGLLLAAFPGSESFPEWRHQAETLGLPFTGNSLPDTEEMVIKLSSGGTQVDYYEDTITQKFNTAAAFFRHLKDIGAGQQLEGRSLTPKEMKLLINHWDEQTKGNITVSYHIVFLAVKKNHTANS